MPRTVLTLGFAVALSAVVFVQTVEPPVMDTRLTVHTLVREDVFAGFLQQDLNRLARAEKNLDILLSTRPAERPALVAWMAATALTRAVQAHEQGHADRFEREYARALALFEEALRLGPDMDPVLAIVGGASVMLADRLPADRRAAAWERGYAAYRGLWARQGAIVAKLPLHHQGELLGGLAESALRTGRTTEADEHLDRLLALLPGTPYALRATQWKTEPARRDSVRLTCQTCHADGTLTARLAALSAGSQ
jgi:tetratricopeptide (TPR) repeat protein